MLADAMEKFPMSVTDPEEKAVVSALVERLKT